MQKQKLCNKELDGLEYDKISVVDKDLLVLIKQKKYINLNKTLYSQLGKASDNEYIIKRLLVISLRHMYIILTRYH